MRTVSRFESNLLQILHCVLGLSSSNRLGPLLRAQAQRPACLCKDAVELVQEALAKGSVLVLARESGWQRQRFMRDEDAKYGRLWQRTKPENLGLEFSPLSLDFLIWLTETDITGKGAQWKPGFAGEMTTGDRFLAYLVIQTLEDVGIQTGYMPAPQEKDDKTKVHSNWRRQACFKDDGLIALMHADRLAAEGNSKPNPDFGPWMTGVGSCILETMQSRLAERWQTMERRKATIVSPSKMRRLGEIQGIVLDALMTAAKKAGRLDLCRFLLITAQKVLPEGVKPKGWLAALNISKLRIADRTQVYQSALATLHRIVQLQAWNQESQGIGYFDEGYGASQLWKSDWETYNGEKHCDVAQSIIQEMEPLKAATPK